VDLNPDLFSSLFLEFPHLDKNSYIFSSLFLKVPDADYNHTFPSLFLKAFGS
jgi:hypothetical protein